MISSQELYPHTYWQCLETCQSSCKNVVTSINKLRNRKSMLGDILKYHYHQTNSDLGQVYSRLKRSLANITDSPGTEAVTDNITSSTVTDRTTTVITAAPGLDCGKVPKYWRDPVSNLPHHCDTICNGHQKDGWCATFCKDYLECFGPTTSVKPHHPTFNPVTTATTSTDSIPTPVPSLQNIPSILLYISFALNVILLLILLVIVIKKCRQINLCHCITKKSNNEPQGSIEKGPDLVPSSCHTSRQQSEETSFNNGAQVFHGPHPKHSSPEKTPLLKPPIEHHPPPREHNADPKNQQDETQDMLRRQSHSVLDTDSDRGKLSIAMGPAPTGDTKVTIEHEDKLSINSKEVMVDTMLFKRTEYSSDSEPSVVEGGEEMVHSSIQMREKPELSLPPPMLSPHLSEAESGSSVSFPISEPEEPDVLAAIESPLHSGHLDFFPSLHNEDEAPLSIGISDLAAAQESIPPDLYAHSFSDLSWHDSNKSSSGDDHGEFYETPKAHITSILQDLPFYEDHSYYEGQLIVVVQHKPETEDLDHVHNLMCMMLGLPEQALKLERIPKGVHSRVILTGDVMLSASTERAQPGTDNLITQNRDKKLVTVVLGAKIIADGKKAYALTVSHGLKDGEIGKIQRYDKEIFFGQTACKLDPLTEGDVGLVKIHSDIDFKSTICCPNPCEEVGLKEMKKSLLKVGTIVTKYTPEGLSAIHSPNNFGIIVDLEFKVNPKYKYQYPVYGVVSAEENDGDWFPNSKKTWHKKGESGIIVITTELIRNDKKHLIAQGVGILFAIQSDEDKSSSTNKFTSLVMPLTTALDKLHKKCNMHLQIADPPVRDSGFVDDDDFTTEQKKVNRRDNSSGINTWYGSSVCNCQGACNCNVPDFTLERRSDNTESNSRVYYVPPEQNIRLRDKSASLVSLGITGPSSAGSRVVNNSTNVESPKVANLNSGDIPILRARQDFDFSTFGIVEKQDMDDGDGDDETMLLKGPTVVTPEDIE